MIRVTAIQISDRELPEVTDKRANILASKMNEMEAVDLSDEEIRRCLGSTVMPTANIRFAREYRDLGILVVA